MQVNDIRNCQPTLNVGCIGHVSHGKSTLINALSNTSTLRFSSEKKKNSTIHLGYANMKIYEEDGELVITNQSRGELVKHLSFVDCPGHESYIANMLNGSSVMDFAFLIVDASDPIVLQTQAEEHLNALLMGGMNKIICLQNKIDLLNDFEVRKNKELISNFLEEKFGLDIPIIPVSAQFKSNIDFLKNILVNIPERDLSQIGSETFLPILRSFDINKPNQNPCQMKGGVIGGSILAGYLKVGDEVIIAPGFMKKGVCHPIKTKVLGINTETESLEISFPGGLIGVQLDLDSFFTKNNNLVGQVLYQGDNLRVYDEVKLRVKQLGKYDLKSLGRGEIIKIHCLSYFEEAEVLEYGKKIIKIKLRKPLVYQEGVNISIFRKINGIYKIYYLGRFEDGKMTEMKEVKIKEKEEMVFEGEEEEFSFDYDDETYEFLLKNHFEKGITKEELIKIVYPKLEVKNRITYWMNIKETIKNFEENTRNKELGKYFYNYLKRVNKEFMSDNNDIYSFKGILGINRLMEVLKQFRNDYLNCETCGSSETMIEKENKDKMKVCFKCGSKKFIS